MGKFRLNYLLIFAYWLACITGIFRQVVNLFFYIYNLFRHLPCCFTLLPWSFLPSLLYAVTPGYILISRDLAPKASNEREYAKLVFLDLSHLTQMIFLIPFICLARSWRKVCRSRWGQRLDVVSQLLLSKPPPQRLSSTVNANLPGQNTFGNHFDSALSHLSGQWQEVMVSQTLLFISSSYIYTVPIGYVACHNYVYLFQKALIKLFISRAPSSQQKFCVK